MQQEENGPAYCRFGFATHKKVCKMQRSHSHACMHANLCDGRMHAHPCERTKRNVLRLHHHGFLPCKRKKGQKNLIASNLWLWMLAKVQSQIKLFATNKSPIFKTKGCLMTIDVQLKLSETMFSLPDMTLKLGKIDVLVCDCPFNVLSALMMQQKGGMKSTTEESETGLFSFHCLTHQQGKQWAEGLVKTNSMNI